MAKGLELTPGECEQLGRAALDWALRYFGTQSNLPVYPTTSAAIMSRQLSSPLPDEPQDFAAVMSDFEQMVVGSRHNGHPRMFGTCSRPAASPA